VRQISGDKDYQFGDITKGALGKMAGKSADEYQFGDITKGALGKMAGKSADEYQFGDITKGALGKMAGKSADEYQFGDITRKVLTDADRAFSEAREAYFNELPMALFRRLFGDLDESQRRDVMVALCHFGAVVLLSYSLVLNMQIGLTTALAWCVSSTRTGLSPLAPDMWSTFVGTYSTLRLALEAPLLPLRALATLVIVPKYRNVLISLHRRLPLKESSPVLNRLVALAIAWFVGNIVGVSCVTAIVLWLGSTLVTGVPLRPQPLA
jgi:hypothetical protein